jgi:hypothetical protein
MRTEDDVTRSILNWLKDMARPKTVLYCVVKDVLLGNETYLNAIIYTYEKEVRFPVSEYEDCEYFFKSAIDMFANYLNRHPRYSFE